VEAGDQGACSSADPSSFVPSQDGPRSSAPFAGPQLDLEAALGDAPASEVNDGPCPEKPDHLTSLLEQFGFLGLNLKFSLGSIIIPIPKVVFLRTRYVKIS
jgi:hypothetical protein